MSLTLSGTGPGRTWDEAAAPGAVRLARQFETAWRANAGSRPDLDDFLPGRAEDRPGARLALLRADLALRWEAGEKIGPEWYRDRLPDLDDETFVALIYEEFCLREEEQGPPDPADYYERFPTVAGRLRRVLDIHGLVGSGSTTPSTAEPASGTAAVSFPEVGQTIAGFHLVEELGRGAFARVFLAHERQLADRPVALKVSRTGSREPQTLARLQHTHIVPVHSYRTDPATGLHLLCMPYFGRVTLARVLTDPTAKVARFGSDLVAAIDRLGPDDEPPAGRSAGRGALDRRSYPQAIAWWGARMAEALEHAHDRGVLHRDVKPSNVLVTADGMPMLLDFNLARESVIDGADAVSALGGTLDYMAPEHLDELADGVPGRVDARSDVYGLGVLLYESLAGARPFPPPQGALSALEILLRAAEERREGPPPLRDSYPEVPAALDAVVRRCLDPNPARRYASAADLAADLQAVADDEPLRFAREPLASRAQRLLRRNRRSLVLAAPTVLALALLGSFLVKARLERGQLKGEIGHLIEIGRAEMKAGDFDSALVHFNTAGRLAEGRDDLLGWWKRSRELATQTAQKGTSRSAAEALARDGESIRFGLIGLGGDLETISRQLQGRLAPFYVLAGNDDWTTLSELSLLDPPTRSRLIDDVDELLFLWALALARSGSPESTRQAVALCDRALVFVPAGGPWAALKDRLIARPGAAQTLTRDDVASESSATACFERGRLREEEGRRAEALAWLRRSIRRGPDNAWRHAYLALVAEQAGNGDEAREHADAAVALRPQSPWTRTLRARIEASRGDRAIAVEDYQAALLQLRRSPEAGDPTLEGRAFRELSKISE